MGRAKTAFAKGAKVGWWTLERVLHLPPTPGRTGDQWTVRCKCGARSCVTHEALRAGRSRACDGCAKAYRQTYNAAEQLADLGAMVLGDGWAELYATSPQNALAAAERRISAERIQLETFARLAHEEE